MTDKQDAEFRKMQQELRKRLALLNRFDLPSYRPDPQEFEAAAARLTATSDVHGGPEPAAVAWLLNFIQATSFAPLVIDTTLYELVRFAADGGQRGADYGQARGTWDGCVRFQSPFSRSFEDKLQELQLLQRMVRHAIEHYLQHGEANFPPEEGAFTIMRGVPRVLYSGTSLAGGVFFMAGQLLARYGHRVKVCEGCPRIMFMGRKDQRFHSQKCQVGTFFRKRRAEEKQTRRRAQAAKVRAAVAKAQEAGKKANERARRSSPITHGGQSNATRRRAL
jgi:hypothetical protein